ncbi:hypothetical protein E3P98_04154 [Wallemia ichthyophaga]|nr:hypothetical protein E3P98_04154 [Wallemia ichthyophaga]
MSSKVPVRSRKKTINLSGERNIKGNWKIQGNNRRIGVSSRRRIGARRERGKRPVAYLSQKLNGSQLHWSIRDKELFAIIVAITKWKHYLLGRSITVNTDHKTIETFRKAEFSSRVAKWSELWAEYDIEVKYKPGKDNKLADALSRKMELNVLDLTRMEETFQEKLKRDYQEDKKIKEKLENIQNNENNTNDTC